MTGALRRHRQPRRRGGAQHLGDLVGVAGVGHGRGVVVDEEVPGRAGQVVRRVAGQVHRAAAEAAQVHGPGVLPHRHESLLSERWTIVAAPG